MHDDDLNPRAVDAETIHAGHEVYEIGIRRIFLFGLGLVVVTGVAMLALSFLMKRFAGEERRLDVIRPALFQDDSNQYPEPRLQRNYTIDMKELLEEDAARLSSYGWVDRPAGVAHIPIERAMAILAERGLHKAPAKKAEATPKADAEPKK